MHIRQFHSFIPSIPSFKHIPSASVCSRAGAWPCGIQVKVCCLPLSVKVALYIASSSAFCRMGVCCESWGCICAASSPNSFTVQDSASGLPGAMEIPVLCWEWVDGTRYHVLLTFEQLPISSLKTLHLPHAYGLMLMLPVASLSYHSAEQFD